MTFRDNFAVLRDSNFRPFYIAVVPNQAAWSLITIGLPFAVLHVSDSPRAIGLVAASNSIPMVLMLLVGGVVSDRIDRTLVLRGARLAGGIAQGIAATLVISGHAHVWTLMITEAIVGVALGMSFPAFQGLVPELAPREHLQQANALMSMSRGVINIVGPSVAALLVATVGGGWTLATASLMFFVSATAVSFVKIPKKERTSTSTPLADLREGWVLFRSTTWFWVVVSAFMVINAIHSGAFVVLAPYVAKHTIGVRSWGFALSAEAIGLLAVTFVMLRLKVTYPLRLMMTTCLPIALPVLVLGLYPHVWALVPVMIIEGACFELGGLGWNLAMQENIPAEMMSRAYSYDALGSFLAIPIGQLVYGSLGSAVGYRPMLVGSGIAYLVLTLCVFAVPAVRSLRRVEPATTEATA